MGQWTFTVVMHKLETIIKIKEHITGKGVNFSSLVLTRQLHIPQVTCFEVGWPINQLIVHGIN